MRILSTLFFILMSYTSVSQNRDSVVISNIFEYALENSSAYEQLEYLTTNMGSRLSGSEGASKAVKWAKQTMESFHNGEVYLQDVMVPHWVRNDIETLTVKSGGATSSLNICSLGGSIPTPVKGITAKVVEINSTEHLDSLGRDVEGKIVFWNTPMNPRRVVTFKSYGEVGKYRYSGARLAAYYGAVASITRSLTLAMDDYPHTGSMGYADTVTKIPAAAISTVGAEKLSRMIKKDPNAEVTLTMNCETFEDKLSYNVIGEIKGSEKPDEIIVVSGHLDAWDKGTGAHDDGAGCVQAMELLKMFRDLGIKPWRTIRVVLFMNEENGLKGAKKYAASAKEKKEKHIAAIESDAGGFTPHGFAFATIDSVSKEMQQLWKTQLFPYGLYRWANEGGGADINQLKDQGTLLIGLSPDSQRYFDYHHSDADTFDKINKRELNLGAAAMAAMAYLLSEYGVDYRDN